MLNRARLLTPLKRAIYTGRISPAQAKRVDEMQAVADALSPDGQHRDGVEYPRCRRSWIAGRTAARSFHRN